MKSVWAILDLVTDVAVAYHDARKPRAQRLAADAVLLILAGLLGLTALGLLLAAAFIAMSVLGQAVAAVLTAVIALALAGIAFGISRWVT
jgi:uncharacterized protein (DUF697 family)